jgi:hypothetical protein
VTVELARHLVQSGVLSPADVEAALLHAVTTGQSFVKVLVARSPVNATLVDRELGRLGIPALQRVRLARDLARGVPRGMCARLLAVPVGRDIDTGAVEVAAADPLDPHVAEEFGFHLEAPVTLYRASVADIETALEAVPFAPSEPPPWSPMEETYEDRTPAFGTSAWRSPGVPNLRSAPHESTAPDPETFWGTRPRNAPSSPSEPPIPLVRRVVPNAEDPELVRARPRPRFDTSPGLGFYHHPAPKTLGNDESGQPVIGLTRSKPSSAPAPAPVPPTVPTRRPVPLTGPTPTPVPAAPPVPTRRPVVPSVPLGSPTPAPRPAPSTLRPVVPSVPLSSPTPAPRPAPSTLRPVVPSVPLSSPTPAPRPAPSTLRPVVPSAPQPPSTPAPAPVPPAVPTRRPVPLSAPLGSPTPPPAPVRHAPPPAPVRHPAPAPPPAPPPTPHSAPPTGPPLAPVLSLSPAPSRDVIAETVAQLPNADSPEAVVDLLATGASSVAARVLVFAVKSKSFDGRAGRGVTDERKVRALSLPRGRASVLDAAAQAGRYQGPVPATPVHGGLRELLTGIPDAVYAVPVVVSERPALMLLIGGADDLTATAERIAPLVRKAGFAIERIVLSRKL